MLERRDGGRGSAAVVLAAAAALPRAAVWRAGVLGMPGRCSQEKGTAEARSGERKRWWNGDGAGEKDGKEKERPPEEDEDDDDDEDEVAGTAEEEDDDDSGRSCRLRRRRVAAVGAGGGDEEEGLGIAVLVGGVWSSGQSRSGHPYLNPLLLL